MGLALLHAGTTAMRKKQLKGTTTVDILSSLDNVFKVNLHSFVTVTRSSPAPAVTFFLRVPSDPNTSLPFFLLSLSYLFLSLSLLLSTLPTWIHSIRVPLRVLDTQTPANSALRARSIGHTKSTLTCQTINPAHSSTSPKRCSSTVSLVVTTRQ
jgi:hypothetical protein